MTDDARYWLLAGTTPTGPVTLADLHARLADGRVTGETKVCRVGDAAWVPLVSLPGVGPPTVSGDADGPPPLPTSPPVAGEPVPPLPPIVRPVARPIARPVTPAPAPESPVTEFVPEPVVAAPPAGAATTKGASEWVGFLVIIGVASALAFGVYSWLIPLSPRDVAQRFMDATTAANAKAYAVPSFHRAVDEIFRDQTAQDPTDTFEMTGDGPIPGRPDGHFVAVRGRTYFAHLGRKADFEGVIVLTKHGGWKVFDIGIFSVDGRPINPPTSLAASIPGVDRPPVPLDAAKDWYANPVNHKAAILGGGFLTLKLLPKVLLGLGIVIAGIVAVFQRTGKRKS